jgi:hypothetical protein
VPLVAAKAAPLMEPLSVINLVRIAGVLVQMGSSSWQVASPSVIG